MTKIEIAEAENVRCRRVVDSLNHELREALRLSAEQITRSFYEDRGLTKAKADLVAAEQALDAAFVEEAQSNPLVGKKVAWRQPVKVRGTVRTYEDKTLYGIVEIFDSNTVIPDNMPGWRQPKSGTIIIRHLRADGTPGLKFDLMINPDTYTVVE